jgi:hypothetical protein
MADKPAAPTGSKAPGRALWDAVLREYELDAHELLLLTQACRTADQLEALDAAVRRDGVLQESPQGTRAHPALVEARQQRLTLARLLAALRLPLGAEGDEQGNARQPQRRGAPRAPYGIARPVA